MTEFDHPLDVDLEVLAKTEECLCPSIREGALRGFTGRMVRRPDLCRSCKGSGRVPSKLWRPWKPTTCPTCGSEKVVCDRHLSGTCMVPICRRELWSWHTCPDCSAGLVVPQVGDLINWTVENLYEFNVTASRTVARSTVHQTAPIATEAGWAEMGEHAAFVFSDPGHVSRGWPRLVRFTDDPMEMGQDLTALLDGPWAELWVPGNWAIEISTEVLDATH